MAGQSEGDFPPGAFGHATVSSDSGLVPRGWLFASEAHGKITAFKADGVPVKPGDNERKPLMLIASLSTKRLIRPEYPYIHR